MGGVDFRSARHHEPPRAKRKCRVVLRNSRSRSSSHSENDAEYLMGLRKTGSSREYNSIDVRFSITMNEMALAMRHQRLRQQIAISEGDDEVKALTQSLAAGMKIDSEESPMSPGPVLATILESTEAIDENSATDLILEEYISDDNGTMVADDEESIPDDASLYLGDDEVTGRQSSDTHNTVAALEVQFVKYAAEKWHTKTLPTPPRSSLPPISFESGTRDALPSLHDMGVSQFLPDLKQTSDPSPPPKRAFYHWTTPEGRRPKSAIKRGGKYHDAHLPDPMPAKPVHYPHKPVHYAPNGTQGNVRQEAQTTRIPVKSLLSQNSYTVTDRVPNSIRPSPSTHADARASSNSG